MKVLNLYCGIGGNRKLWEDVEVTAIEWDPNIAAIYQDLFPEDVVIVTDAHQYLLEHFREYDFIWSSPPCQTHSFMHRLNVKGMGRAAKYPNMSLYQEIILLDRLFNGLYCVENVRPYYEPLIKPQVIGRHCYWANFIIRDNKYNIHNDNQGIGGFDTKGFTTIKDKEELLGFDLSKYSGVDKHQVLNNCVLPEVGKIILDCARGNTQQSLSSFSTKDRIDQNE